MKYYVYLLQSEKDKGFYIGQTQDVAKRLSQHNDGKVKSTCRRRPFSLLGFEEYKTRAEARFREYQVKQHSDRKRDFILRITGGGI